MLAVSYWHFDTFKKIFQKEWHKLVLSGQRRHILSGETEIYTQRIFELYKKHFENRRLGTKEAYHFAVKIK